MRSGPGTRYLALDGFRAIAAGLVMLHHYNADFLLGLERWSPAVPRLYLLVDFFFVLSGFVIMTSYGDRIGSPRAFGTFLVRRLARLYPLHLLVLAGFLVLAIVAASGWVKPNHPEHLAFSALPSNLLLTQAWGVLSHPSFNVPSWSISAEWLAYLLFPLAVLTARRLPLWLAAAGIVAFVAAFAWLRQRAGLGPWTTATHDFGALRALPSFLAGVLVAQALSTRPHVPAWARIWAPVWGLAALALVLLHVGAPDETLLLLFVAIVAAAAMAERSGTRSWLMAASTQRLGAASYAIYMIHVLVSIPVLFVLRKTTGLGGWQAGLGALATAAVVVVLADLLHRRFELPWQGRLNRLADSRRTRLAAREA